MLLEQKKIQESDAIVFIYPVFWTEAPAKLVGWFDRTETGEKQAMEAVMLGDRIRNRAEEREIIIFDNITHWNEEVLERMKPIHAISYAVGYFKYIKMKKINLNVVLPLKFDCIQGIDMVLSAS